ncbi:MAG: DNA polymerase III subunit delta [Prevotella sp.]|nr:DNA polymerase III subunit delta [Prevotella sp.]
MAEKQTYTFDSVMADLQAGNYKPVYLLMGDEPYYIDLITDYIMEHALEPDERDFNQNVLYGVDTNCSQIVDMAKGYPMMAERQVLVVKEAQNIRSWEPMEHYLEKPMPTTVLVICYKNGKVDRRQKWVQRAEKAGVVLESKKKKDYELPAFIDAYLRSKGATADQKSRQMIADHVGADLSRLVSELDKVLISLPENNRRITPDIVEREIGVSKDFNIFEMKNAIIARDIFKANQIVKYFDSNPKAGSLYAILPNLFNYFQNLMIAYYAPGKRTEEDVAKFLDLNNKWSVRDYMTGMRNYTGTKTLQIIYKIREIDAKSKGLDNPNTGAGELMKELIYFILH